MMKHYYKSIEREFYALFKALFAYLGYNNPGVLTINYEVQGLKYRLKDIFEHKPNLGTYNYLMKKDEIASTFENIVPNDVKKNFNEKILEFIQVLKDIRNENMHGKNASLKEAEELRDIMLRIGKESILMICLDIKARLNTLCKESYKG